MAIVVERSSRSVGADPSPRTSTPPGRAVDASPLAAYLDGVYRRHRGAMDGAVATYIPELGRPTRPGSGSPWRRSTAVYEVGDADVAFTIQSISKPFTYGLALEDHGRGRGPRRSASSRPATRSTRSARPGDAARPLNPMVNAGAIAAAALVAGGAPGATRAAASSTAIGRFAGRPLAIDEAVYESERATGHRNRAIGHLLRASASSTATPTRRSTSTSASARSRSPRATSPSMAATLANGGVNPMTGERALGARHVRDVLSVMATCGMYDGAGRMGVRRRPAGEERRRRRGPRGRCPGQLGIARLLAAARPAAATASAARASAGTSPASSTCIRWRRGTRRRPTRSTPRTAWREVGSKRRRIAGGARRCWRERRAGAPGHRAPGAARLPRRRVARGTHWRRRPAKRRSTGPRLDLRRVERIDPPAIGLLAELVGRVGGARAGHRRDRRRPHSRRRWRPSTGPRHDGGARCRRGRRSTLRWRPPRTRSCSRSAGRPGAGSVGHRATRSWRALRCADLAAVAAVIGGPDLPGRRATSVRAATPADELLLVERGRMQRHDRLDGRRPRRLVDARGRDDLRRDRARRRRAAERGRPRRQRRRVPTCCRRRPSRPSRSRPPRRAATASCGTCSERRPRPRRRLTGEMAVLASAERRPVSSSAAPSPAPATARSGAAGPRGSPARSRPGSACGAGSCPRR